MTNLFSMEYPHWLIIAGLVLVVLGCIGLAYRQRADVQSATVANEAVEPTEGANEMEQGPPEFLTAPTQANRNAKLAEQTRDRWAKTR